MINLANNVSYHSFNYLYHLRTVQIVIYLSMKIKLQCFKKSFAPRNKNPFIYKLIYVNKFIQLTNLLEFHDISLDEIQSLSQLHFLRQQLENSEKIDPFLYAEIFWNV